MAFGGEPELLTLVLEHGLTAQEAPWGIIPGPAWNVDGPELEASVVETFRLHVLRFLAETSTREAAAREVEIEHKFGDCGPLSRYCPRVNR